MKLIQTINKIIFQSNKETASRYGYIELVWKFCRESKTPKGVRNGLPVRNDSNKSSDMSQQGYNSNVKKKKKTSQTEKESQKKIKK